MSETATNAACRLGNCEVCAAQPARYACPKCEVKTCSLPCVQIHKRELNCDGIRNRTKFLPLSEMTAREFMSDYCFLEECTRYTEQRKQDRWKHQRELPVPLQRLRTAAKQRGIQLKLLQSHFSRRQQNTSFLDWKLSRLYWRVEWIFTHSLDPSTHFVDARCDEQLTLTALLTKYFNEPHKQLQPHQAAGIGQVSLWLRAEGVKRSGTRCFQLAPHKTLAANLAGKTIIEFPTIYVSYEQRPPEGLEAIDSDEELDIVPPSAEVKPTTVKATQPTEPTDVFALAASFETAQDDASTESSSDEHEARDEV